MVKERIEVRYLTLVRSALADAGASDLDLDIEVHTDEGELSSSDTTIDLTGRAPMNGSPSGADESRTTPRQRRPASDQRAQPARRPTVANAKV